MSESDKEFFTKNHQRLNNISAAANVFAWISLVVFVILAVLQFISSILSLNTQFEMAKIPPITILNSFLTPLIYLVQAIVYWLILKGISMGLNMIIETDLNYKERLQGENRE